MMEINCALDCIFEKNGKCGLTHIAASSSAPHPSCIYYRERKSNFSSHEEKNKADNPNGNNDSFY